MWGAGGLKNDIEGMSNEWVGNVVALDTNPALHNGYDGTVSTPGNAPYVKNGYEQHLESNFLVYFGDSWEYAMPICNGTGKTVMRNNSVWTRDGQAHLCGYSFKDWQALGNDPGSTLGAWDAGTIVGQLIARGRQVLWEGIKT